MGRMVPVSLSSSPEDTVGPAHRPLRWLGFLRGSLQFAWLLGCVGMVFAIAFAAWLTTGVVAHWAYRPLPGARPAIFIGGLMGWCLMATGYEIVDAVVLQLLRFGGDQPARLRNDRIRNRGRSYHVEIGVVRVVDGVPLFFGVRSYARLRELESVPGHSRAWATLDGSGIVEAVGSKPLHPKTLG